MNPGLGVTVTLETSHNFLPADGRSAEVSSGRVYLVDSATDISKRDL